MKLQRTLLVILLLCLALPSLAAAEQDDFAVEPLEDGGVAITRYRGKGSQADRSGQAGRPDGDGRQGGRVLRS